MLRITQRAGTNSEWHQGTGFRELSGNEFEPKDLMMTSCQAAPYERA